MVFYKCNTFYPHKLALFAHVWSTGNSNPNFTLNAEWFRYVTGVPIGLALLLNRCSVLRPKPTLLADLIDCLIRYYTLASYAVLDDVRSLERSSEGAQRLQN